jgi:hypothetical protein
MDKHDREVLLMEFQVNDYKTWLESKPDSIVKAIACGQTGKKQELAKQVAEARGIDLTKRGKQTDYSTVAESTLLNIISMPHVSDKKRQLATEELERRHQ